MCAVLYVRTALQQLLVAFSPLAATPSPLLCNHALRFLSTSSTLSPVHTSAHTSVVAAAGALASPTGVAPVHAPSLAPPINRLVGVPPSVVSLHGSIHFKLLCVLPLHPPSTPPTFTSPLLPPLHSLHSSHLNPLPLLPLLPPLHSLHSSHLYTPQLLLSSSPLNSFNLHPPSLHTEQGASQ